MSPLLEARGLRVVFGGVVAVDDVSFHVDEGMLVGFIGPNGAGKTACIEAIKLFESPLLDGCDERWVVRCDEADALGRLAARGMEPAAARARLANQTSQEAKVAAADRVIDGSAPIGETRRQVEAAYRALMSAEIG